MKRRSLLKALGLAPVVASIPAVLARSAPERYQITAEDVIDELTLRHQIMVDGEPVRVREGETLWLSEEDFRKAASTLKLARLKRSHQSERVCVEVLGTIAAANRRYLAVGERARALGIIKD